MNRLLAWSLAGAANTANAYRPFARRSAPSVLCFGPGVLTSELPLHAIAAQAAGLALHARRGDLRSWQGKLGLGITAASWAALVGLHAEARRSGEVLEAALVDELGREYRSRIAEPFTPTAAARPTLRQVALPVTPRRRYTRDRDLAYGDHGTRNLLDIWRRSDLADDARAPVLLQVHGGAWAIGNKEQQAVPLMAHLAERGWVCVAINYRLSPRATWPDLIVDVKRALAWIKQNIDRYGGDPGFVAVTGGSAGGHLSSLVALTAGEPLFQPGFEEADTAVQAAVPFYGIYDFTNRDGTGRSDLLGFLERLVFKSQFADDPIPFEMASPMSHVRPDAPPFFVLHGANDSLAPVEQARSFVGELRKGSLSPVVYGELPRAQHAWELFASVRALHTVDAIDRFLGVAYGDHLRGAATASPSGEAGAAPAPPAPPAASR